jgi:hypothetical protein
MAYDGRRDVWHLDLEKLNMKASGAGFDVVASSIEGDTQAA